MQLGVVRINDTVLSWKPGDGRQLPLSTLSLTSDDVNNPSVWTVHADGVNNLARRTPGLAVFTYLWLDFGSRNSFVFEVRACSDAIVTLPEFHGIFDYHTYEVHFGENNRNLRVVSIL